MHFFRNNRYYNTAFDPFFNRRKEKSILFAFFACKDSVFYYIKTIVVKENNI